MKNYKIKTSFVSLEGPKARANKTGINFRIFILIFVENCFSVWLRTDSNPADSNRFRIHTGKYLDCTWDGKCYETIRGNVGNKVVKL